MSTLNKILLLLLLIILLSIIYFFSIFPTKPSVKTEITPIHIEQLVLPKAEQKDEEADILAQLEEVSTLIQEYEPSEEEEANEVFASLEESVHLEVLTPLVVVPKAVSVVMNKVKKPKHIKKNRPKPRKHKRVNVKKRVSSPKIVKHKVEIKKVAKKKILKKKIVAQLKKPKITARKKRVKKIVLAPLLKPVVMKHKKVSKTKKNIALGVVSEAYVLSEKEQKNFKNLELVGVSKSFSLEETPAIKSPKYIKENRKQKMALGNLSFVKTLGVVNVSKKYDESTVLDQKEKEDLRENGLKVVVGLRKEDVSNLAPVKSLGVVNVSSAFESNR